MNEIDLDYIKYFLMLYLEDLRRNEKIQHFQIKDDLIIINPYPKIIDKKDDATVLADFVTVKMDINLESKEMVLNAIQRIKTSISNVVSKEYNRRTFYKYFPTDKQIIEQSLKELQPTGRVLGKEESDGFLKGANWVLEFIKNSL